ncbi:hypothetical protein [Carnobacterium pleistocenium]|uniref:hypothetical protein n=1 Tax=Carnobacterium pleistocenium TaxID=181073 RepID=UPI00055197DC|nr:hypothetical protein [Carnobacterium pleistocenium]
MKKFILVLMSFIFLSACTATNTLHTFSIDARTKDVALENLVIVSNEDELYIQPTYQLFAIEHTDSDIEDLVQQANMNFYDKNNTLFYSVSTGANQEGILDTRTTLLEGDLVGFIIPTKNIDFEENLFIEFIYEKNDQEVIEKVKVVLQENN